MPRGRPSTRGTPAAAGTANTSREASVASVRITRSASTRSQAASSASTPVQGAELQAEAPPAPRPRGRPRKSAQLIEIASSTAESSALDVAPPKKRRGRPSKAPIVIEIESTSSAQTPQDGTSESGYSTPATSKVPTPAATDSFKSNSNLQVQAPGPSRLSGQDRERGLRNSIYSMKAGTKDNRIILDSDDDDFPDNSRDVQLARRLQQEDMAQYTTSSLPRRSARTFEPAGLVATPAPQKAPAKRGRSSTNSAPMSSRPSKKSKVDRGSDIDMDAEIAAAAGLDSDDDYALGFKSEGDASFADLDDASDGDEIAELSSEDDFVPFSRRRQARA
ncbi:hypothetical protein CEP51_016258, partial [Fusarium floridanum]